MSRVYVTPRSITKNGHPSLERLRKAGLDLTFARPGVQPTEAEQLEIVPECVAYLAGIEPIRASVLEKAKLLRVISRNGVGVDRIDLETAKRLGIEVRIAAGSNAQGVAELAIGLMLSAVRWIPVCSNRLKEGIWKREQGIEVAGKTLGVIGCGNIGRKVVHMALGLGMKVKGFDPLPDALFQPQGDFRFATLGEIFEESDVISLHCPPGEDPLIGRSALEKMKVGVCIVNTARAELVDESSVLDALNRGRVQVYATDVYASEPPEADELVRHERTLTTPHIGAYTLESMDRAVEAAVGNILEVLGHGSHGD